MAILGGCYPLNWIGIPHLEWEIIPFSDFLLDFLMLEGIMSRGLHGKTTDKSVSSVQKSIEIDALSLQLSWIILFQCTQSNRHTSIGLSLWIFLRILSKSSLGTATSVIWNVKYLAWDTIFAPILIRFSRWVVSDQSFIALRRAKHRTKFARL